MERRDFLRTALAGSAVGKVSGAGRAIPKRRYRDNVKLSIVGYGGIIVVGMEQAQANRSVASAVERGVNYFDVAPTYWDGEAEIKLGEALKPHRKNVFLACKTTQRDAAGAQKELDRSLGRLQTDHFDLYQFHGISKVAEVDQILGPGGAAETFDKARKAGKVRYIGCSVHSTEAALAMLERFPLDSVLFPVNFVCFQQGNFGPQILAKAKEKGAARLALKGLCHEAWPKGTKAAETKYPKCWYKPVDEPELGAKALRFTLSEDITAAITPGYEQIFTMALDIAAGFKPMKKGEREQLLASTAGLTPIFKT